MNPSPSGSITPASLAEVTECQKQVDLLAKQFEENKARLDAYQKKKDDHQKRLQDWEKGTGDFSKWKSYVDGLKNGTLNLDFSTTDPKVPQWARDEVGYDGACWDKNSSRDVDGHMRDKGGVCGVVAKAAGLHKGEEYRHNGNWDCCGRFGAICSAERPRCSRPKERVDAEKVAYEAEKPKFEEKEPALDNTSHTVMCCNQPISVDVANAKETNLDNIKSACNFNSPLPPSSPSPSSGTDVVETTGGGIPWWYWALGGGCLAICVVALIIMAVMFGGGGGRRH